MSQPQSPLPQSRIYLVSLDTRDHLQAVIHNMSFPVSERDIALDIVVDDKSPDKSAGPPSVHAVTGNNNKVLDPENTEANEVFRLDGQVNYRTMGWVKVSHRDNAIHIPYYRASRPRSCFASFVRPASYRYPCIYH